MLHFPKVPVVSYLGYISQSNEIKVLQILDKIFPSAFTSISGDGCLYLVRQVGIFLANRLGAYIWHSKWGERSGGSNSGLYFVCFSLVYLDASVATQDKVGWSKEARGRQCYCFSFSDSPLLPLEGNTNSAKEISGGRAIMKELATDAST